MLFIALSRWGFAGAFLSEAEALEKTVHAFPATPFLLTCVQSGGVVSSSEGESLIIWVVENRNDSSVLYVSNDPATAERVRESYARIGLAGEDCWRCPVGSVPPLMSSRFEIAEWESKDIGSVDLAALEAADRVKLEALTAQPAQPEYLDLRKYVIALPSGGRPPLSEEKELPLTESSGVPFPRSESPGPNTECPPNGQF